MKWNENDTIFFYQYGNAIFDSCTTNNLSQLSCECETLRKDEGKIVLTMANLSPDDRDNKRKTTTSWGLGANTEFPSR